MIASACETFTNHSSLTEHPGFDPGFDFGIVLFPDSILSLVTVALSLTPSDFQIYQCKTSFQVSECPGAHH